MTTKAELVDKLIVELHSGSPDEIRPEWTPLLSKADLEGFDGVGLIRLVLEADGYNAGHTQRNRNAIRRRGLRLVESA